jgi:hypothetical protein
MDYIMIRKWILIFILSPLVFSCTSTNKKEDYHLKLGKVPFTAKLINDTMSIWCGSLVKADDGLYHIFYSRWPKKLGWAWVTDSEIAHAVSQSPYGPFAFKDVALPRRGAEFWDGICTHNPTVHKFGNQFYLYYMGNTGDGFNPNGEDKSIEKLNWVHRNNQRIGVAVADDPNGPWKRFDKPIIDISTDSLAIDALCTTNPSITQRPDGGFLMVYKVVGKKRKMPSGGPVLLTVATSETPVGPFVKYNKAIFEIKGDDFPAEDPYIWYQAGKYRAIFKRREEKKENAERNSRRIFTLELFESIDGFDWNLSKKHLISDRTIEWENGKVEKFLHLERPQLYFENNIPVTLLCAADTLDGNGVRQTFNLQIPITMEAEK